MNLSVYNTYVIRNALVLRKKAGIIMDANGLNAEQQALLASIMGKSSQQGGGGGFAATPAAAPAPAAAPNPADAGKMLSQAEIDALIASMNK